ncbi:sensor histidine kinase [Aquariibacter albus]|uniref:Histidine kinase n=1 Tax=Aquariibacter albus TaxID=2759899 RepID=A0A839HJ29_9BURK|nr:ATP-binding protein [Aquariibacter albus]MBB1161963.1 histidine kinase [Aquariibacter albus]
MKAAESLTVPHGPGEGVRWPGNSPPPAEARYAAVELPDEWAGSRPGHSGTAWYRIDLPSLAGILPKLPAVYIPRVCSTYSIWLNGTLLHQGGDLQEPYTMLCYRAQLVSLPPALLRERGNRLDIAVAGYALGEVTARQRAGGLSEMYLGPQNLMAELRDRQMFWNVTLGQSVALMLLLTGVFLFGVGWAQRLPAATYLGLVGIGAAVVSARPGWTESGMPLLWSETAWTCAYVPVGVCGVQFLLRHAGIGPSRRDGLLWLQVLLVPIAFAIAGPQHRFAVAAAAYALLVAEVIGAAVICLRASWLVQGRDFLGLALGLGTLVAALLIEVGIQDRVLSVPTVQPVHLALPPLLLALVMHGTTNFLTVVRALDETRRSVEQRIREAVVDAERQHAIEADQRAEQMAQRERKRIAGDLHDDLGAKLLTIVHTSGDERISTLAREALEEMRLSVRGLAGKPVQLGDALADWRSETVGRLGEAGIEMDWVGDEPELPRTLSARTYVQTTRILREAVSNIIKHSGASLCKVRCSLDADLHIVIHDNGRGMPAEMDGPLDRGHGISSMKNRAKQMQGQCLFETGPGYGTAIRLTIPL